MESVYLDHGKATCLRADAGVKPADLEGVDDFEDHPVPTAASSAQSSTTTGRDGRLTCTSSRRSARPKGCRARRYVEVLAAAYGRYRFDLRPLKRAIRRAA